MSLLTCALLVLGVGCGRGDHRLGKTPASPPNEMRIAALAQRDLGQPATLRGTMIEKCPVAGCWFILRDQTGTIKVDTKAAGFVVVEVPLNKEVLVAGIVRTNGSGLLFEATGLRY